MKNNSVISSEDAFEIWCDFQSVIDDLGYDNSMGDHNYLIVKFMHDRLAPHGLNKSSRYLKANLRKFLKKELGNQ